MSTFARGLFSGGIASVLAALVLAAASGCGGAAAQAPAPARVRPEPAEPLVIDRAERAYLMAIHDRLHARWHAFLAQPATSVPGPGHLESRVTMVIDGRGRPVGVELERSSGVPRLDLAALEAVTAAGPLPPAPWSLRSDDGFTRVRWRFSTGPDGCSPLWARTWRDLDPLERALPMLVAAGRIDEARGRLLEALAVDAADAAAVAVFARALLEVYRTYGNDAARANAVLGLAAVGEPAARAALLRLLDAAPPLATRAAMAVSHNPTDATPANLLPVVRRNDGRASVVAAEALARRGHTAELLAALGPALAGPDPTARAHAARALCGLRDPRARAVQLQIATDASLDPEVRARAIEGAGQPGDEEAARRLARLVASPTPEIRAAALVSLGRTRRLRLRTRVLVIERLRDPALQVRAAAAATLVRIATGPAEWRGPLAQVPRSGDLRSGLAAVEALGALADPHAHRALAGLASHPRIEVRTAAWARLRGGARPPARSALPPEPTPARSDVAAPRAGEGPSGAVRSADLAVACAAARGLAHGADRPALAALARRLGNRDQVTSSTLAAALVAGRRFECPGSLEPSLRSRSLAAAAPDVRPRD